MLASPRLEFLNTVLRFATLGVLVYIAVQLSSPRAPDRATPAVADTKLAARPETESKISLVRIVGDVNVTGSVDVNRIRNPITLSPDSPKLPSGLVNGALPVTIVNPTLPVRVTNQVSVDVTNQVSVDVANRSLPTEVTNFRDLREVEVKNFPYLKVEVTNFHDMPH